MSVTLNQPSGLTEPQTNISQVTATLASTGTYTVFNDGSGNDYTFASNPNDAAAASGEVTLYSDANDINVQQGTYYASTRALVFDLRAANGFNYVAGADNATSYIGAVVGWNSDSILIRVYNGLNPNTHAAVGPTNNYYVISAESLVNNNATLDGIPQISGAAFGQDPTVLEEAARALGLSVTVACFTAGTRILTPHGEVPVEALAVGEIVLTASGEERPIRWIGRREIDCARYAVPGQVQPVCIRAGAFGAGRPRRDLSLSPDHAVFEGGVLIPIRQLLTNPSIVQTPVEQCTYFHLELDRHDLLLAEGLAVESYLDTGNRAEFALAGLVAPLFADQASRIWEARGYAPLMIEGPAVDAARQRLRGLARTIPPAEDATKAA